MTLHNAVSLISRELYDSVSEDKIIMWISQIEDTMVKEIAETHEGLTYSAEAIASDTDRERELFAKEPYAEIYSLYAAMKNDLALRDSQRYINSAAAFSAAYYSFADMINRNYKPLGEKTIKL